MNMSKLSNQVNILVDDVGAMKMDVGDIKVDVSEIKTNVALILDALPEQMLQLRSGLERLVSGSVGAMLRRGVAEELMPLREEMAELGAAIGDQVACRRIISCASISLNLTKY